MQDLWQCNKLHASAHARTMHACVHQTQERGRRFNNRYYGLFPNDLICAFPLDERAQTQYYSHLPPFFFSLHPLGRRYVLRFLIVRQCQTIYLSAVNALATLKDYSFSLNRWGISHGPKPLKESLILSCDPVFTASTICGGLPRLPHHTYLPSQLEVWATRRRKGNSMR